MFECDSDDAAVAANSDVTTYRLHEPKKLLENLQHHRIDRKRSHKQNIHKRSRYGLISSQPIQQRYRTQYSVASITSRNTQPYVVFMCVYAFECVHVRITDNLLHLFHLLFGYIMNFYLYLTVTPTTRHTPHNAEIQNEKDKIKHRRNILKLFTRLNTHDIIT